MTSKTVYDVDAYREGKWWIIRIPALDNFNGNIEGITQARRIEDIDKEAIDYICTVADVNPSSVAIKTTIWVGKINISDRIHDVAKKREKVNEESQKLSNISYSISKELSENDIPMRDISKVLGVSHQRVHDILKKINKDNEAVSI